MLPKFDDDPLSNAIIYFGIAYCLLIIVGGVCAVWGHYS